MNEQTQKASFAELEIGLSPAGENTYALDFRFWQPGSDAEARPLGNQAVTATFAPDALAAQRMDPAAYGQLLSGQLFAHPRALIGLTRARTAAQALNLPLRLRLLFAPGASALHALAWETLTDPEDDFPLALKEDILFSRVLTRQDDRPLALRPRKALRAVILAANPTDLGDLDLPPVDVPGEVSRATQALEGIQVTALSGPGRPAATLNLLLNALRSGEGFDVLYLVCHGGVLDDKYWLVLENEQRKADRLEGETFVQALKGLANPPRLVALSACRSAKLSAPGADSTFAARLAEAGIPAVLAMQDDFSMDTAAAFLPAFFREMARDGQIDRAASVARFTVRERFDFWVPALFTCLKSGKIWQDEDAQSGGAKYNIHVKDSKGIVIGDHNVVTQNFD